MDAKQLYQDVSFSCSKYVTNQYSTSFSLGIKMFDSRFRMPICAIYGFVRLADEIVDTFHEYDKLALLQKFRQDTFEAIHQGISFNPILHSFQIVVNHYNIDHELITAFLDSMEMDIDSKIFNKSKYEKYIYGSAEVVGLMCLKIFVEGDQPKFDELKTMARGLGSAFQKINFLRDINSDFVERGRVYFPNLEFSSFSEKDKKLIEDDIQKDFDLGLEGIRKLPLGCKLGVYLAYVYYINLFNKIKATSASLISEKRIRVKNRKKMLLLFQSAIKVQFNMV